MWHVFPVLAGFLGLRPFVNTALAVCTENSIHDNDFHFSTENWNFMDSKTEENTVVNLNKKDVH